MSLDAIEFMRRFLLHVLPRGLVRIRYFGFLANRRRTQKLELCRTLLAVATPPLSTNSGPVIGTTAPELPRCPVCKTGHLLRVAQIRAEFITFQDTS